MATDFYQRRSPSRPRLRDSKSKDSKSTISVCCCCKPCSKARAAGHHCAQVTVRRPVMHVVSKKRQAWEESGISISALWTRRAAKKLVPRLGSHPIRKNGPDVRSSQPGISETRAVALCTFRGSRATFALCFLMGKRPRGGGGIEEDQHEAGLRAGGRPRGRGSLKTPQTPGLQSRLRRAPLEEHRASAHPGGALPDAARHQAGVGKREPT